MGNVQSDQSLLAVVGCCDHHCCQHGSTATSKGQAHGTRVELVRHRAAHTAYTPGLHSTVPEGTPSRRAADRILPLSREVCHVGKPHPSCGSPELPPQRHELSPACSSDASFAATPRRASEEWDAEYGRKIVYRLAAEGELGPLPKLTRQPPPPSRSVHWVGAVAVGESEGVQECVAGPAQEKTASALPRGSRALNPSYVSLMPGAPEELSSTLSPTLAQSSMLDLSPIIAIEPGRPASPSPVRGHYRVSQITHMSKHIPGLQEHTPKRSEERDRPISTSS